MYVPKPTLEIPWHQISRAGGPPSTIFNYLSLLNHLAVGWRSIFIDDFWGIVDCHPPGMEPEHHPSLWDFKGNSSYNPSKSSVLAD